MIENPMYLADAPEPEHSPQHLVDLKWSLWSYEKETWDERYPDLWEKLTAAFLGITGPVSIETAPRKEIRFGSVTIREGAADVDFTAEWDSGRVFQVEDRVLAPTFEDLMHLIDHREVDLMRVDHKAHHGRKGEKLLRVRCHQCGYPYQSTTSQRLAEND